MFCASTIVTIALLSIAQVDQAEVTRLPPTEDSYYLDESNFLGPDFEDPALWSEEEYDDLPGTEVSASWLAAGGSAGFGTFDLDVNHSWLMGYNDWPPVTITPGIGLHFWSGPTGIDLPARVYDLYLDLQWRPIEREKWGVSVGLIPGLYGDFEVFDGRTLQLTGYVLGNYNLTENATLVGGAAYVRQLQNSVLPVGGLIWTPNEDWRLELLVPSPKVARRMFWSDRGETWFHVAGEFGGGSWAVADTADSNVLVSYSDLRLLLGIESYQSGGKQYSMEIGYVFSRNISVNDSGIFNPEDTVLLQASMAY